jgi:Zn-dependent protease with chaperone function
MARAVSTAAYRRPGELLVLGFTLLAVLAVIVLTATATLCGGLLFIGLFLLISYSATRSHHDDLMRRAQRVNEETAPNLTRQVEICRQRLQPGDLQVYLVRSRQLNAYTFGLDSPKVVVLYGSLLQILDEDELRFVIGHEMGHVRLGHTWLNSLVGGMAGIPSSIFVTTFLALIFRGWSRACEYSADRAGLLACGNPEKAISALVKLVAPRADLTPTEMSRALARLDAEDDDPGNVLGEFFATHPLTIRRVKELQQYAASSQYRKLQALVDQNLAA